MRSDIYAIDAAMLRAGRHPKGKSSLGANAILAVSIAACAALPPLLWKCPCTAFWAA